MDRIEIRGLRVVGTHGVLAEERERAQPFEVDLDLELDFIKAGRSDALGDTVDYGSVVEAVVRVITGPHSNLLEHLGERIAGAALNAGAPLATAVTVTVRKLRPPVPFELGSAGVTLTRPSGEPSPLAGGSPPGSTDPGA
ncbi:MAG TPA: dihydroneopterin aldolase [Acidimicrobiales bacterium]|nr:dihydroneopterin aldolase [Acidimicrobiales bacterium]